MLSRLGGQQNLDCFQRLDRVVSLGALQVEVVDLSLLCFPLLSWFLAMSGLLLDGFGIALLRRSNDFDVFDLHLNCSDFFTSFDIAAWRAHVSKTGALGNGDALRGIALPSSLSSSSLTLVASSASVASTSSILWSRGLFSAQTGFGKVTKFVALGTLFSLGWAVAFLMGFLTSTPAATLVVFSALASGSVLAWSTRLASSSTLLREMVDGGVGESFELLGLTLSHLFGFGNLTQLMIGLVVQSQEFGAKF